ncbi:hypothetical protein H2198_004715 [Neophaeococcomyces mojaviensis]|uniref:Uncharacterized protein n=1 Tax=Neophaeococcomyces mojaviensis TaxID=3383035 RepID=A0ACC3A7V1_9EURO|nr:hypothetical protein H2198_004715 [Knufia sp. JES_112]
MSDKPSLVVLPYLQGWDGSHLFVRVLLIPRGDPLAPLDSAAANSPSFPTANFKFDFHLLNNLEKLPSLSSGDVIHKLTFDAIPAALGIFKGILAQLTSAGLAIDPNPPGDGRAGGAALSVYKHLPTSYRDAVGTVSQSKLFPTGKRYSCMLKERTIPSKYVKLPQASKKIAWGRLIAALLRKPKLAEAAGLIRSASIPVSPELLENGAFVFLTVAASSDAPKLPLKTFAARISTIKTPQDLFSPVFFPVQDPGSSSTTAPLSDYINIFAEAEDYDDGWAKAVHCTQPQQLDPMNDKPDGTRPVGEMGIRIGWDDEQVTTWLDRQMDPTNIKLDGPLGVQGYRLDVQTEDSTAWHSLVRAQGPCIINGVTYAQYDGDKDELGVEVHPSQQLDTDERSVFWLPIYFAAWSGPSLVTTDNDRIRLTGGKDQSQEIQVKGVRPDVALTYGNLYKFRVRLMDHTGGGPTIGSSPSNPGLNPISKIQFRRWIRPLAPIFVSEIPVLSEELGAESAPSSMEVKRPKLTYPAVVCTGHYSNPVELLLRDLEAMKQLPQEERREPSLPDPDVDSVEITVWISTLTQDPLATDGAYMKLYTTTRKFPTGMDQSLTVNFSYNDVKDIFDPIELPQGWNWDAKTGPLLLPKSRTIRLKVVALCKEDLSFKYFGAEDVRRSLPVLLSLRQNSSDKENLLVEETTSKTLNAYFLQPDATETPKSQDQPADVASRLATMLGLRNKGMTMCSMPGERIVFACSGAIRHTLGPDRATVSFATQVDITLRWVTVIRLVLNRDWTWDGFGLEGIRVRRDGKDILRFAPNHNLNHDALLAPGPDRKTTTLVIFDAIDPDSGISTPPNELHPKYTVSYSLIGRPETELVTREFKIDLPVTSAPRQTPRIVSSGIALSPYIPSDDYSTTNVRQKVLWIEFAEPVLDPRDNYFCRMLRNMPDPLIGVSSGDTGIPEPALPIPLERTLRVIPDQSNDWSGLDAMQPLAKSVSSNRHFSIPLPPGMSPSSPELFGFFTYEFRIGHADPELWTTAQGRFGPPLRCAGIQHPAPQLTCSISRTDSVISVSAPCAISVRDGMNATPDYNRPRMFVLLYAQAVQIASAASQSAPTKRNILLFTHEGTFGDWSRGWSPGVTSDPWAPPGDRNVGTPIRPTFPDPNNMPKKYATATFSVDEVNRALDGLGLWRTTSLSALAVEMLPQEKDPVKQPLGADIGRQRILRTSTLCAVPARC